MLNLQKLKINLEERKEHDVLDHNIEPCLPIKVEDEDCDIVVNTQIRATPHQQEVLDAILEWYDDDKELFALVDGAAGTGKTVLIELLVKQLKQKGIAIAAPTHKALNVLKQKIKIDNIEFITDASLVGLRPEDDLSKVDPNNPEFKLLSETIIQEFVFIANDEASMLDKKSIQQIKDVASEYDVKVLFVGDMVQLPPVGESFSPIFMETDTIFTLTELVRQKNTNPLIPLLNAFRSDILNELRFLQPSLIEKLYKTRPEVLNSINISDKSEQWYQFLTAAPRNYNSDTEEGYSIVNEEEFHQLLEYEISINSSFKYLDYTNIKVKEYNEIIRIIRYPEEHDNLLIVGEKLMAYSTITKGYGKDATPVITNSKDYIIVSFEESKRYTRYETFVNRWGNGAPPVRHLILEGATEAYHHVAFKGYNVILKDVTNDKESKVFILHPDSYKDYVTELLEYFFTDHERKGSLKLKPNHKFCVRWFYALQAELLTIHDIFQDEYKNISTRDNSASYLMRYKSLDRADAITIHKSQASTYEVGFVNMVSILNSQRNALHMMQQRKKNYTEKDITEILMFFKKLLYVALSRCSKRVYLLMK